MSELSWGNYRQLFQLWEIILSMLDPDLCQEVSPTQTWAHASWALTGILSQPGLVFLALLGLAVWPWVLHQSRWKKPSVILSGCLMVGYLLILSPVFMDVGNRLLVSFVPPDSGEKADAIVVLGRGPLQNPVRAQAAKVLWQKQRAPLLFSSGRIDAPLIAGLVRPAVPAQAVSGEPCSATTEQNAAFTTAILWPQGVRKIILITDPPHMLRSLLTFESFGFKVIPHMIPLAPGTSAITRRFLIFRESLGLVSYGLMGRYFTREVPPTSVIYAHQPRDRPSENIDSRNNPTQS
ncbi:MAG: YdcF family protein [Phormidesmis sp. RL_2_1]|nr:YdcF family protein [Phormidesmis sp. RL_2_1]